MRSEVRKVIDNRIFMVASILMPERMRGKLQRYKQLSLAESLDQVADVSVKLVTEQGVDRVARGLEDVITQIHITLDATSFAISDHQTIKTETFALIESLKKIQNRGLSTAVALPTRGNRLLAKPFLSQFLSVVSQSGALLKEVIYEGDMETLYRDKLKQFGVSNVRHANLHNHLVPLADQAAVPLILVTEEGNLSPNSIFYPISSTAYQTEDPLLEDYIDLLKSVAALHLADLLAMDETLLHDSERLRASLIARLGRFEGVFNKMVSIDQDRHGFFINTVVAKSYLEMRTAQATAQAA